MLIDKEWGNSRKCRREEFEVEKRGRKYEEEKAVMEEEMGIGQE